MERISANGAEFEVEEAGTGEPLLLIHGSIIGDAYKPLLSHIDLSDLVALGAGRSDERSSRQYRCGYRNGRSDFHRRIRRNTRRLSLLSG